MQIDATGIRQLNELAPAQSGQVGAVSPEEELGKTAFLELMIAQISNQDPLEPAKNEAFIAQLAQFSSVEGIQNLNESMDALVSSLQSGVAVDAAGLVGRNVLIQTNQTALNTRGGISGTVELGEPVADLAVEIRTLGGDLVHRHELGAKPSGSTRFDWDGRNGDGNPVEQNFYRVEAIAEIDGLRQSFPLNLPDQVVSVSIEQGGLMANLAGGGSVAAAQIKEIQ